MEDWKHQHGTRENPIRHEEVGHPKPVHQTVTTESVVPKRTVETHNIGHGLDTRVGGEGHQQLRRSGSSSSSSSEDDGMGGRRKKGIKEKVKEKLPGQHRNDPARAEYENPPPPPPKY